MGTFILACVSTGLVWASTPAYAYQLPPPPLPVDPTPLEKLISAREQQEVANANQPRKLIEVYLRVSDAHLEAAHAAIKTGDYQTSERELDIYKKASAEALKTALAQPKGRRGLTKKIEQRLFKQIKVLELIERLFPVQRVAFAEAALKHARQLRVQALNTTFDSGEVLDEPGKPKGAKSPPADSPPAKEAFSKGAAAQGLVMAAVAQVQRPPALIPGDYLNEEEDDHVRAAQSADDRIKVFMKIADRRLQALSGPSASPTEKKAQKKAEEEQREWGLLPELSRVELLRHYARAVEEAMAKLEDAYERNPKSSAIPKALTALREATDRHLQILKPLQTQTADDNERAALMVAIDQAEIANKGAREGLKQKQ
jgi:hypothetical protein